MSGQGIYAQFFEIAVCDIVTTPIWHRIELDAVGKLHLVLFIKCPGLGRSLCCPFYPLCLEFLSFLGAFVIYELVLFDGG